MKVRTRAAMLNGRYPWRGPTGYRNVGGQAGPNIVPDEHAGPLIRRGFELVAIGEYTKAEVLRMLTDEGLRTAKGKPLSMQTFHVLRGTLCLLAG
jgi:hypothetical protein